MVVSHLDSPSHASKYINSSNIDMIKETSILKLTQNDLRWSQKNKIKHYHKKFQLKNQSLTILNIFSKVQNLKRKHKKILIIYKKWHFLGILNLSPFLEIKFYPKCIYNISNSDNLK